MNYLKSLRGLKRCLSLLSLVCLFGALGWAQQNLLANPGFETGDFTGWTVTGNSQNFGVNINGFVITGTDPTYGTVTDLVHSGNYAGYALVCDTWCDGPPYGMYLGLSQTLNLTAGDIYTASLWLGNGSDTGIGLSPSILINGQPIYPTTGPGQLNAYQYGQISANFVATQPSTTVTFIINGSGTAIGGLSFDDFSVVYNSVSRSTGGWIYLLQQNDNQITSYRANQYSGLLIQGNDAPFGTGSSPVAAENSGPLVYVADQGSSQISAYFTNFNNGTMAPVVGSPYAAGLAPNAIGIDHGLQYLYAAGLDSSGHGAIAGWKFLAASGVLTPLQGSPFSAGTTPGAMTFDRSGHDLYVLDTSQNQILGYSIDPSSGLLTPLAGSPYSTGNAPVAITTNQLCNCIYVAASGEHHIYGYQIASDGSLTSLSNSPFPTGDTPVSLTFDHSQRYLYVVNQNSNNIWGYQINDSTGALSVVPNSPFSTGAQPLTIATVPGYVYVNTPAGVVGFQINSTTGTLSQIQGSPMAFYGTALAINAGGFGTAH